MKYEVVIGLETHVELSTRSKLFCSCGGHASPQAPNDCVCPACSGMPGMLPVANREAIELAIKAGLILNCKINRYTTFDRKSYFYPDLPGAYQITQWFNPICVDGQVEIKDRSIGIKQIHLEEDAGKLIHDEATGSTLVDYNRAGVPLIEIVSRPDFRSSAQVVEYLEWVKDNLRFAGVSECEEGAMRCDVNISVRPEGSEGFGVRSEIKNMSSFTEIRDVIEFEKVRHMDAILRHTEVLIQETRRWDPIKRRSFPMRSKETAADYRYFPDPNLMPILIDEAWINRIRAGMQDSVDGKSAHYVDLGIAPDSASVLASDRALSALFDGVIARGASPKAAAGWLLTECLGHARKTGSLPDIDPEKLAWIIKAVESGDLTRASGRTVLARLFEGDIDPESYCKAHALFAQSDESAILAAVQAAIAEDPSAVQSYLSGKTKALEALFGICMRSLKGNGSPARIRALLEQELAKKA